MMRARPDVGRTGLVAGLAAGVTLAAAGCLGGRTAPPLPSRATAPRTTAATKFTAAPTSPPTVPPVADSTNVYAHTQAGMVRPDVAADPAYVYVPSNDTGTVTVIDQATFKVVDTFHVGKLAQHVVPAHDLHVLYATASGANRLVPIDPTNGRPGRPIPIAAPYNLYFTPDGHSAVVMAERLDLIDYYDPTTWTLQQSVKAPCRGVNHADWSADERWYLVTCEFSGQLIKVDSASRAIVDVITLPEGAMPQDIRLTPDGQQFYVADMAHDGVLVIDAASLAVDRLIHTGVGAHGIYPSRDGTLFYISNRGRTMGDDNRPSRDGEGSVSVVDPAKARVIATWSIPHGGSPDMGGVSADGKTLWLSGRFDAEVYAFDTATGSLIARIAVPPGPHGLCVFPQPGRYSLGHTGNDR